MNANIMIMHILKTDSTGYAVQIISYEANFCTHAGNVSSWPQFRKAGPILI